MCINREKRLQDPVLEKYVFMVVLDTINAFFSSPFSENSTSLQVSHDNRQCFCNLAIYTFSIIHGLNLHV